MATVGPCEKCGNEPGGPYTFLFGTSETHQTSTNTYRTTYSIKGIETVSVGSRCIGRRKRRTWIWLGISLAIVLAVVLTLLFGVESGEQTKVFGVPAVVFFLVGPIAAISAIVAGIMLAVYRDPAKAGMDEAEKLKQRELKKRGFNFTAAPDIGRADLVNRCSPTP
jgi:amino acid transporter